jgi:hypothetical protein
MRDPAAFEALYRAKGDVWHFATDAYERSRYERILATLARPRYGAAYEPGCSVGVLSEALAHRCGHLLAVDVAPTAVDLARARCADLANVELRVGSMLDDPPAHLDLVVLSEVGYYVEVPVLKDTVDRLVGALDSGGELLACHWLGHSDDHRLHGDTVHELIDRHASLRHHAHEHRRSGGGGFRIDSWERT